MGRGKEGAPADEESTSKTEKGGDSSETERSGSLGSVLDHYT